MYFTPYFLRASRFQGLFGVEGTFQAMNEHQNKETAIAEISEARPITPSERILAPLSLSDYSQFLYNTNYGGKAGKDFTAEGIKTIAYKMVSPPVMYV